MACQIGLVSSAWDCWAGRLANGWPGKVGRCSDMTLLYLNLVA